VLKLSAMANKRRKKMNKNRKQKKRLGSKERQAQE
jgi:hypothetical protein